MDDLGSYRALTADEIVLGLSAIGQAVVRHATPQKGIRATLAPDGVRIEGYRGIHKAQTMLIPFRDLKRKPAHLLAQEIATLAARL
ncbi:hypothetical protein [Methylobacterium nodulans]|uniref:Uncharacterized protein n=1 Tax=Methylobacterium nodulans (strain LMG 21967 / CNCM I-2342 / ORS 2060) TaxID=460265 RepID=B8IRT4_METNO|nr:hypothetical protein [Methylobacterium nodulans]ACL60634.1 hypothetical protein Mnod_5805 [Methylobacterium nodulans ORS 2060]